MNEVSLDQLKQAVEGLHNCTATLSHAVAVHEKFKDQTVWQGVVHVFDLTGHPAAKIAYAWSSPVEGSDRRKFYAVLELPPITSAVEALRAAILGDERKTKRPIDSSRTVEGVTKTEARWLKSAHEQPGLVIAPKRRMMLVAKGLLDPSTGAPTPDGVAHLRKLGWL